MGFRSNSSGSLKGNAGTQIDINKTIADDKETTCASFVTKDDCEKAGESHGLLCEFKIVCLAKIYHQMLKLDKVEIKRGAQLIAARCDIGYSLKNEEYVTLAKDKYQLEEVVYQIDKALKLMPNEEALKIAKKQIEKDIFAIFTAMRKNYDKAVNAQEAKRKHDLAEWEKNNPKPDPATIKRQQEEARARKEERAREEERLKTQRVFNEKLQAQEREENKRKNERQQKEELERVELEYQKIEHQKKAAAEKIAAEKAANKEKAAKKEKAHEQKIKNLIADFPLKHYDSLLDVEGTLKLVDEMTENQFSQLTTNIKKYSEFDLSNLANNLMKAPHYPKVIQLFDAILTSQNAKDAIGLFIKQIANSTAEEKNLKQLKFKKEIVSLVLQKKPNGTEIFGFGNGKIRFTEMHKIMTGPEEKTMLFELVRNATKDEIEHIWHEIESFKFNDAGLLNLVKILLSRADTLKVKANRIYIKNFLYSAYRTYTNLWEDNKKKHAIAILISFFDNATSNNGIEEIFFGQETYDWNALDRKFIENIAELSGKNDSYKQALINFIKEKASENLIAKLKEFIASPANKHNTVKPFIEEILTAASK